MREIKFRVTDNKGFVSSPFNIQDLQDRKVQFTSDCSMLQYIGLKDKDGTEVYEGDILSAVIEGNVVEREVFYDHYTCGFVFGTKGNFINMGLLNRRGKDIKVVGNIHEIN